jgi:hypothetical protein
MVVKQMFISECTKKLLPSVYNCHWDKKKKKSSGAHLMPTWRPGNIYLLGIFPVFASVKRINDIAIITVKLSNIEFI